MIPEFKLNTKTTANIIVNTNVKLKSTRIHVMIYVHDKNTSERFVKSITFSLLGLHQVRKAFLLINLNKVDKKDIILKV